VGVAAADVLALVLAVVVVVVANPLAVAMVVVVVLVEVLEVLMPAVFRWPPTDPDLSCDDEDINVGVVAANETMRMEAEDAPSFWPTVPAAVVVVVAGAVVVLVVVDGLIVLEELLAISREMGDHKYEAIYDDDFS